MENTVFPRMHVSIYVTDIASTVNFYSTFFGQPATKVKKGYAKYELTNPGLIISFVENPERVSGNFGHLGIQVGSKEEMDSKLETARTQGIVSLEEIGTACCYAVQDKFWVTDPDGVQWEVYYFHEDVEFNDPKYSNEDNSACCMPEQAETVVEAKPKIKMVDLSNSNSCEPGSGCC
jgi:catechol 2,3-dioxygenase-like lactoylglutathione lyase family enzyme